MNESTTNSYIAKIRPIQKKDIKQIAELEKVIFTDPWEEESFTDLLGEQNWGGFVAETPSGIIGYACYYIAVSEAHLTNIAVVPEYRRKLVAHQLLENILTLVVERNCEFLLLEVRPSNSSAIAFYRKYGFVDLYTRPGYYHNPPEAALVMVKYFEEQQLK